jgi:hypothetical protein
MKTDGGVDLQMHIFLTLDWLKVSRQLHAPDRLAPRKNPLVLIGEEIWGRGAEKVWTTRRTFLTLQGLGLRLLGRPVRGRSRLLLILYVF